MNYTLFINVVNNYDVMYINTFWNKERYICYIG